MGKTSNKQDITTWFEELRKNYETMSDKDKFDFHTPTKEEIDSIRIKAYKFII